MKRINEYPARICKSQHACYLCMKDIKYGERYYDGGYGRRAHVKCGNHVARYYKDRNKKRNK